MTTRSIAAVLIAACLPTLAGAATGITLSTGYRNVQLGVIDLTPADGSAASYTLDEVTTRFVLSAGTIAWPFQGEQIIREVDGPAPPPLEVAYLSSHAGTVTGLPGNFTATATVGRDTGTLLYGVAAITQRFTITLAAHSMLTVAGDYFRHAAPGDGPDIAFRARSFHDMSLSSGNTYWSELGDYVPVPPGESVRPIWYALANTSDSASTVYLSLGTYSNVEALAPPPGAVSPVPEPATYAMLLAGLGIAGVFAGSHRRRHCTGRPWRIG